MNILVLGGGAQGRVIATDTATRLPQARVTVADVRDPRLTALAKLAWRQADCSSLDTVARAAGVTITPDAGLAPGISNLVAGAACARLGPPRELVIMVGGVAQDRSQPYGYCVAWSLDDLTEEYTRPARIVQSGRRVALPVFSGMEDVEVAGVGGMVAFYSDGLRSLMDTLPGVPEMGEKTLRWPGHVEAVTLVDRHDPATGLTAMACTTAFTTAVTAQMVVGGLVPPPGVQPLEKVARDDGSWRVRHPGFDGRGDQAALLGGW
jgi:saccharopine dehydrogenase-like NADP-dependent oxidoreductase